jgi:hypothetical protein
MTSIDTSPPRPCLATTAQGQPCRASPMRGADYCFAHRHQAANPSEGQDQDPPCRILETIDDVIDVMYRNLSFLCAIIDQAYEMQDIDRYLKTLGVYSRCLMHLSSLLRTKQALGPPAPSLLDMIDQAVDELAEEQGWTALLPGSPLLR